VILVIYLDKNNDDGESSGGGVDYLPVMANLIGCVSIAEVSGKLRDFEDFRYCLGNLYL
jgi:hypothetical protein